MELDRAEKVRRIIVIATAFFGFTSIILLFIALWINRFDAVATGFILSNWRVILGMPFSCFAAFFIVALFRQGAGPLEFEGVGFKFKGSAGEVVMWIFCFLSIIGSIKLLS